jgi:hypothetical protein
VVRGDGDRDAGGDGVETADADDDAGSEPVRELGGHVAELTGGDAAGELDGHRASAAS